MGHVSQELPVPWGPIWNTPLARASGKIYYESEGSALIGTAVFTWNLRSWPLEWSIKSGDVRPFVDRITFFGMLTNEGVQVSRPEIVVCPPEFFHAPAAASRLQQPYPSRPEAQRWKRYSASRYSTCAWARK